MLLQTNSYIVPKEKRAEHARLLARFRTCLARLGCDHFEAYEQVGANWAGNETTGRFVQIMRFRDRKQQQQVQGAERSDPQAQQLIKEFCELINFPYQQQQGLFAVGFYTSVLAVSPTRLPAPGLNEPQAAPDETGGGGADGAGGEDHDQPSALEQDLTPDDAMENLDELNADAIQPQADESDESSPSSVDPSIHHS